MPTEELGRRLFRSVQRGAAAVIEHCHTTGSWQKGDACSWAAVVEF